jgi:hypothetical protein
MARGRGNPNMSESSNWSCCRSCGRLAHWGECAPASADTHPKGGDVQQAPLVSGAVPKADAQTPPERESGD